LPTTPIVTTNSAREVTYSRRE